jgi:hypothetical protein
LLGELGALLDTLNDALLEIVDFFGGRRLCEWLSREGD